jgi:hypothetical protein
MKITIDVIGTQKAATDLSKEIDKLISFVASTFTSEVKSRTPIDEGRARRGWQQRSNQIENRVPYIERLEKGYSKQAPRGFVKQAIQATVLKTKRIIK